MVLRQRMARKPASLGVAGFATRRTSMSSLCITFPFYMGRTFLGDPELAAKTNEYLEKELKVESGQPYKHKRRRFDRKLNEGAPRTCFDLEDLDGCYRCVQPEWTKQQPDIARVDSQEPESQWKHELKNMVHDLEAQEIDTQKLESKSFTPGAWGEI